MRPETAFHLYVHWPYCRSKCGYCDFASVVPRRAWDAAAFVSAYRADIAALRGLTGERAWGSIFFGGGTPSLAEPGIVGAVIDAAMAAWEPRADLEVTLEANPGTVNRKSLIALRDVGVNRLSVGAQSFDPAALKALGRTHSVDETKHALTWAHDIFKRLSMDLIAARPEAECRHNLAVWRGADYGGIGPGAHGRQTLETGFSATRHAADAALWLAGPPVPDRTALRPEERAREHLMMSLRLTEGMAFARFAELFASHGLPDPMELIDADALAEAVELGLMHRDEQGIRLTEAGVLLLDALTARVFAVKRCEGPWPFAHPIPLWFLRVITRRDGRLPLRGENQEGGQASLRVQGRALAWFYPQNA